MEYGRTNGVDLYALAQNAQRWRPDTQATATNAQEAPAPASPITAGVNKALLSAPRSEPLFTYHLNKLGISRVLDIGANAGQFAAKLRNYGFSGTIFSVEPQAGTYVQLLAQTRGDMRWIALTRQGAGASASMMDLNISENGFSSSLRDVHSNHLQAEPMTRTVARERVFINRSADLLRPEVLDSIEAIKIDVQGYEDQVLQGYGPHLANVRLLLLELSIVECYHGAPDLFSLDELLVKRYGFQRVSLEPTYYDEKTGTVQQYDGIYYRPEPPATKSIPLDGVRVGAVVTSIGGMFTRKQPDGGDIGPLWLRLCTDSWKKVSPRVISCSESSPPEGIEWAQTASRPSINEVLSAVPIEPKQHLLFTNADIIITDELASILPVLDPTAVYYGHRLDIEVDPSKSNRFTALGLYPWGFDYFLLPHALLEALKSEPFIPNEFRIGEPWWDYALPIVAITLGFPLKRVTTANAVAVHYLHSARYHQETWNTNAERFRDLVQRLLDRTPNAATGLLTDLASIGGDPQTHLSMLSLLIYRILP